MKSRYIFAGLAVAGLGYGFFLAASHPPDSFQREFARITHVHVPSAWVAFLAFGITMAAGLLWLFTKRYVFDRLAAASAELGVFFTALALLTGMIWGDAVWGKAWDWGDARMASTALMFFVYIGYLALRRSIEDPEIRARRASVLGAIAFLQVPLVYFSVTLWRTLHPTPSLRPDGPSMPTEQLVAMLINLAAYTFIYVVFVTWRARQMGDEAILEARDGIDLGPAGRAIEPPTLGPAT